MMETLQDLWDLIEELQCEFLSFLVDVEQKEKSIIIKSSLMEFEVNVDDYDIISEMIEYAKADMENYTSEGQFLTDYEWHKNK